MSAPRHFVTTCREWQLGALLRSMSRHCRPFALHALAWDWDPAYPGVSTDGDATLSVTRGDWFLGRHPELRKLPGEPRSATDTVCSVRWSFVLDVLRQTGVPVTAIDGDLWFWGNPEPVFAEIGGARCAVSPHEFVPAALGMPGVTAESHGRYGRFNGGWVYFADAAPAEFMAAQARAWCRTGFLRLDSGRELFGDQGHLEVMAEEFGAHVIRHPGVNVGPWNVHLRQHVIGPGRLAFIAYHYSSLRFDGRRVTQLANPEYAISHEQIHRFYDPYVQELESHAVPTAL